MRYIPVQEMMSALRLASARLASCKNSIPKASIRWEIYVKIYLISISSLFLVFNHDFVIYMYIDSTHDAASNTATDDVTNLVTHRIFNTNLKHSCAHFIFKIDKKCDRADGF